MLLSPIYLGLALFGLMGSAGAVGFGLLRIRATSKRASTAVVQVTAI